MLSEKVRYDTSHPTRTYRSALNQITFRTGAVSGARNTRLTTLLVLDGVPAEPHGTAALLDGQMIGQRCLTNDALMWRATTRIISHFQVTVARTHVCNTDVKQRSSHEYKTLKVLYEKKLNMLNKKARLQNYSDQLNK